MYRILFIGSVIVGLTIFSSLSISAQTVDTSTEVEDGPVSSTPEQSDLVLPSEDDDPSELILSETGPSSTPKTATVEEKIILLEKTLLERDAALSKYAKLYDACRFTGKRGMLAIPASFLWSR